jgi:putative holliday junction resolvase
MRALGVDYGEKRIGLALSDASGMLARPWKTIARVGNPLQVARAIGGEVASLASTDEAVGVVVLGLPRRLNGASNEQTASVERIAAHLRKLLIIPLVLQDERLSSHEAEHRLAERERDWRQRKEQIDAMAAAVILQDYLDAHPDGSGRGPMTEDANR